ncbi:MAG: DUF1579 family protein [Phycisphaeraceae bacterium]|nr:DUF1579 family protein [Phycisphaeraceae bacterium]
MRKSNVVGLFVVAGLAYGAGRMGVSAPDATPAKAVSGWVQPDEEMMEYFAAMAEAGMPGEHHEVLNCFEGSWEGMFKWRPTKDADWVEMPGSVDREWLLDGRFMGEHVSSEMPDGTEFEGYGLIGYDNLKGKYVAMWVDNQSTGIYTEEGDYDDVKGFSFRGQHIDPLTKKAIKTRSSIDVSDEDRHVGKGWASGPDGEFQMMEMVFERTDGGDWDDEEFDEDDMDR